MPTTKNVSSVPSLSKPELNKLLGLAQNDRERELVKYTAFRASGLSKTSARKHYGFQDLSERCKKIEESMAETENIIQCINSLSAVQEEAFLESLGYISEQNTSECNEDDSSTEDEDDLHEVETSDSSPENDQVIHHQLMSQRDFSQLLTESDFNWFEVIDRLVTVENTPNDEYSVSEALIGSYSSAIEDDDLCDADKAKLQQSFLAFIEDCTRRQLLEQEVNALNDLIVSDAEVEDPDQFLDLCNIRSGKAKVLIARKRKQIQRRNRYLKSKYIAERNFLSRKVSKNIRGILKTYPNIGEEIEKFVQDCNIGADTWRRTGVLTFDGNTRVKSKVTYERIRQHLIDVYNRNFSYGSVIQLCVARNKRRTSAKRYKGVAKVTSRRARKGFMLKFNPDAHWSAAFYRNLNFIQYTDGRHILNVNRDDAAGYRLDTMTTHRLHRTPMVKGSEATTTYTDYVNKYKAVLQTTSYNFSKTETTVEFCAGIVKPIGLFPKNPTQHSKDFEMLSLI